MKKIILIGCKGTLGKFYLKELDKLSKILVVADKKNNPEWIAADLLSQAEHDINSRSILITNNSFFGREVLKSISLILKSLPRAKIASQSWKKNGAIIILKNFSNVHKIINEI